MVLSFDYAQNVHYPSAAQSVGSVYFKSARKLELFGIYNEGTKKQHTYIVDKAHYVGKGANAVISLLDDYLENMPPKKESFFFVITR